MHLIEYAILLLGVAMCVLIYITTKGGNSYLIKLADRIPLLSEYFLAVGVYYTYVIFRATINGMKRDATYKIIDRGWILPNEKISLHYAQCPKFIDSLYFPWQKKTMTTKSNKHYSDPVVEDNWTIVHYISTLMFQSWEDFLTSVDIDQTGDYVWIANYLQWTQSKVLKGIWATMYPNYANRTITFGNFLFRQEGTPRNAAELKAMTKGLVQTAEYNRIIHMS